jgi:hypothetical protein
MNWLSEYFAQRTSPISVSLWAHPPLVLGPDGPIAQPVYYLPYPGATLVFTPAETVKRGELTYDLPARYDTVRPLTTYASGLASSSNAPQFFREISIFAPSRFNPDCLITVNGSYSFVPVFSSDGAPGFSGTCIGPSADSAAPARMDLPWTFQGYVSI